MSTTLPVVLIVDDEIRSLETLRRTLEEAFEVFTAASTDEALAILQNEFIHVVISDQRMPDMTGVAFLKLVRERWPEVARIILSGYADNADIIAAINEAGRLRMYTARMALALQSGDRERLHELAGRFEEGLELLRQGTSMRPLFVP